MPISRCINALEVQRPHFFLWIPVFFGLGIGAYFSLGREPPVWLAGIAIVMGSVLWMLRGTAVVRLSITGALALGLGGFGYSALRTELVSAPVLKWRYYGPIEGRIIGIDRSASNAPRVLLDQVYLPDVGTTDTPERIRISLQGLVVNGALEAGGRIATTGSLAPPGAPVEPGGFDFRRMAWFMQLGAVGYTRNPVLRAGPLQEAGMRMLIFRARMAIANGIRARIPGQEGAFAAAILTGDRSAIDPEVMERLRRTNLAHLLAISGLHMGLLSGFVFAVLRGGLALVPAFALRFPVKKIAAVAAILAGSGYLVLSGANVATQRAFVMTVVVLMAVVLDRPAFTMRAVALAALIVLLLKPYSLLEAGFQMSFAATSALIVAYDGLRNNRFRGALGRGWWRYMRPLVALLVTSGVAGAATAPVSAYYFNQISQVGLLANLMAVPVMGMVIMPAAVIAGVLVPFGLEGPALAILGKGVGWILAVAGYFAAREDAVVLVPSAPVAVFVLMVSGMVFFVLWQGRGRWTGASVFAAALMLWGLSDRPEVLVSGSGKLAGILREEGRVFNKGRGDGYSARIWLENDGDGATQAQASVREGFGIDGRIAIATVSGWRLVVYSGKNREEVRPYCRAGTLMVLPRADAPEGACRVVDATQLRRRGALAVRMIDGKPVITGSKDAARNRPWGY